MRAPMEVTSPAFDHKGKIPPKYTCEGDDVSPKLVFSDLPKGTKALAIIVDDPDAPVGTFDHWLAWNLPPKGELAEGAAVPMQGRNHFGELRYRGPCPPRGPLHRYFFRVYALDAKLELPEGSTKTELKAAMEDHILGQAILMGTYQR